MNIETRELRIIFQNALAHATQIAVHNGQHNKKEITAEEVIEIAKKIAKTVVTIGAKKEEK